MQKFVGSFRTLIGTTDFIDDGGTAKTVADVEPALTNDLVLDLNAGSYFDAVGTETVSVLPPAGEGANDWIDLLGGRVA